MYSPSAMAALCRNEDWSCVFNAINQNLEISTFALDGSMEVHLALICLHIWLMESFNICQTSTMVSNASKTEAAYFSLQELSNPPVVNIDGIQIELRKTPSVLGLTVDHKLHWVFTLKKSERSKQQKPSNSSRTRTYQHWWLMACFSANSVTAAVSGPP
jgi:hypothetical protein